MKLWQGLVAFCFVFGVLGVLTYTGKVNGAVLGVPVAAFVGWLFKQPTELQKSGDA